METASVSAREINPSCGDDVTVFVQHENGVVQDISFDGHGCAISTAAASLLCEAVQGRTLIEAEQFSQMQAIELLSIPISHNRIRCATLAFRALKKIL